MGISLPNYGGWEVPRQPPAGERTRKVTQLESKSWELGAPVSQDRRRQASELKNRQHTWACSVGLLLPVLPGIRSAHQHSGRWSLFTQSRGSNAELFQQHPPRHTQKQCHISYLNIPQPSQTDSLKLAIALSMASSWTPSTWLSWPKPKIYFFIFCSLSLKI